MKTEKTQAGSSLKHRDFLNRGLRIKNEKHIGQGAQAVSLIQYSNNHCWIFDNSGPEWCNVENWGAFLNLWNEISSGETPRVEWA